MSPTWKAGTQLVLSLESSLLLPRVCLNRKLELRGELGLEPTQYDMGSEYTESAAVPNIHFQVPFLDVENKYICGLQNFIVEKGNKKPSHPALPSMSLTLAFKNRLLFCDYIYFLPWTVNSLRADTTGLYQKQYIVYSE